MTLTMLRMRSPIGALHLVARGDELAALCLPDSPVPAARAGTGGVLALAHHQLDEYFAGDRREFELPLAPEGTAFQQRVWRALLAIRYGETCSYGHIARAIGRPAASRAVGAANGKNPIAIIIPCHRVIGANGTLTGYGGGLPTKQWLLAHEGNSLMTPAFPLEARS
jgi:methylated-DNA-[protein]-cysteine S-methyltransferase